MYESLKPWVNIPYAIKPFIRRSGTGKAIYGEPINSFCYPEAKMQLVKDSSGSEVVSSHTLYIEGSTSINVLDNVIFEDKEWAIANIVTFYRDGRPDCKVVYL